MHSSTCPEKEKDFEKQHSFSNFLQDDLVMSGFHSCLTDVKGRIFCPHFSFFPSSRRCFHSLHLGEFFRADLLGS